MDQVEEVKQKTDIVQIIDERVALKQAGRYFKACCPFHQENTPSFVVSPELQIFKCFGCQEGGDVFTFLQTYEKLTFTEALELLADRAGVKLIRQKGVAPDRKQELLAINHTLARFYHLYLMRHPQAENARQYIFHTRRIQTTTAKQYLIGAAPRDNRLTVDYLQNQKGYSAELLLATGTFLPSNRAGQRLFDRFGGRVIFPLFDHRERIVGFSGRLLPGSNTQQGKYINSPDGELYHKSQHVFGLALAKEAARKKDRLIVVEGDIDQIMMYQSGYPETVAIKGTALTEGQVELLARFTKKLLLFFDSDIAGNEATLKSIKMAEDRDIEVGIVWMDGVNKDPDEALQTNAKAVGHAIEHSLSVGDFLLQMATKRFSPNLPSGQKAIINMVMPFLSKLQSATQQENYFKKLSILLGVSMESVQNEAKRFANTVSAPTFSPKPTSGIQEPKQRYLLELLLQSKHRASFVKKHPDLVEFFANPSLKKLSELIMATKTQSIKQLQEEIPAEFSSLLGELYLAGLQMNLQPDEVKGELTKTYVRLKEEWLKLQILASSRLLVQIERAKEKKQMLAIGKKIAAWSTQLALVQKEKLDF